jgi:hypothetical protein
MKILFPFFAAFVMGSATNLGDAWDSLPEPPSRSNLWLGRKRFEITVFVAGCLGLVLSGLSLALDLESWVLIPVIPCFALTVFALAILVASLRGWLPQSRQAHAPRLIQWLKMAALGVTFVGAFYLGTFFSADHNSEKVVKWSRYHVEGTQANGSGFLNECPEPSPCSGKNPVGRLREGDPAYIECQTKGDRAETIGGETSRVWDRLDSGAFVSDLYVNTSGAGHFSKKIDRCTRWG